MRIYPPPLEIGDDEGFTKEKDIFERAEFGQSMTNLVSNAEDPLVIALDGPWGSGKSIFLRMWAGELRKSGFPVILFDAFENDYIEDAFSALASEIIALSDAKYARDNAIPKKFRSAAIGLGSLLAKSAGKVAIKAASRAVSGGLLSDSDFKEAVDDATKEVTDAVEAGIEDIFSSITAKKSIIETFKKRLSDLSDDGNAELKAKPLIFIIDELDRCRPTFALDILERIKHFFSVPNIHFVIGVNMRQLYESVKSNYGQNTDSNTYIQKFIHISISLPKENRNINSIYLDYLNNKTSMKTNYYKEIEVYAQKYEFSLRTMERMHVVMHMSLSMLTRRRDTEFAELLIKDLVFMKFLDHNLYNNAKLGALNIESLRNFKPNFTINSNIYDPTSACWIYLLEENPAKEVQDVIHRNFYISSSLEKRDIIPDICNRYIDRIRLS